MSICLGRVLSRGVALGLEGQSFGLSYFPVTFFNASSARFRATA
jgi:hypothetical protein